MPASDRRIVMDILHNYDNHQIQFHALRTRVAGTRRFISLHVLVPEVWTVKQGHDLCEEIELAIAQSLPGSYVFTHLEPLEDPLSWQDQQLDRLP
jgi:divalent metal cation (Fe/Co/Zn/Cd) transporter